MPEQGRRKRRRPVCPHCGRPVHRVPAAGGHQDLTMMPLAGGGWSFGPHVCLPRGVRYPMPVLSIESAPLPCELPIWHLGGH